MKKIGNLIFWVIIFILLIFLLYTLYNRFKPNDIKLLPGQETTGQTVDADKSTQSGSSSSGQSDSQVSEGSEVKEPLYAPDFQLTDLEGNSVSLSDYKDRIVFLNFWATTCRYCVQELPDLAEANRKMQESGKGIVLTVNLGEDKNTIENYFKKSNIHLPVLLDLNYDVGGLYGVSGIPITFVINVEGEVLGYISGATDEKTIMGIFEDIK